MSDDEFQEMATEHAATSFLTRENNIEMCLAMSSPPSNKTPANAIFEIAKLMNQYWTTSLNLPVSPCIEENISALEKQNEVKMQLLSSCKSK